MNSDQNFLYDYVVIGSGFGGAVSALRLKEKGYSVLVVEAGRRFLDHEFPRTNRDVKNWLFWPALGCYGIMRMDLFRHAFFLGGAGFGGGSLVYANTLLRPKAAFYDDPRWNHLADWQRLLEPHYDTAEKMLGLTSCQKLNPADEALKKIAIESGREKSFHHTKVGVFFGEPNKTVPDPYFQGLGPNRTGCTLCGNCMVGCRVGAKNTLVKNYLYFAEKLGAEIITECKVESVKQNGDGTYSVEAKKGLKLFGREKVAFRTRGVILSAGVLGSVHLLLSMKEKGFLPKISSRVGDYLRTNSEALVGMRAGKEIDFSKGIAISAGFYPEEKTHVEIVRYGAGSDMIGLISTLLVGGGHWYVRWLKYSWQILRNPHNFIKSLQLKNWAKESIILLVMQNLDNHLRLSLKRRWYWPFKKLMTTELNNNEKVPVHLPIANAIAERMAKEFGGFALGSVPEILLNKSSTAHILGGAVMGKNAQEGVINQYNEVFGYKNLFVVDGSMIPANLGVNPSLTITAMAEHAMSHIPSKIAVSKANQPEFCLSERLNF